MEWGWGVGKDMGLWRLKRGERFALSDGFERTGYIRKIEREGTRASHTPTRTDSSTSGLDPSPSRHSLGLTPTCGSSPINSIGMTKQCYLSNITGRKHWQKSNHINSSGTSTWTGTSVTRTTSTGLSTSPRCIFHVGLLCFHSELFKTMKLL